MMRFSVEKMLKFTRILNILFILSLNIGAIEGDCDKLSLSDDSDGGYICSSLDLAQMNDQLNKMNVGRKMFYKLKVF